KVAAHRQGGETAVDAVDIGEKIAQHREWKQADIDFPHRGFFNRLIHDVSVSPLVAAPTIYHSSKRIARLEPSKRGATSSENPRMENITKCDSRVYPVRRPATARPVVGFLEGFGDDYDGTNSDESHMSAPVTQSGPLRIGIAGAGHFGRYHALKVAA